MALKLWASGRSKSAIFRVLLGAEQVFENMYEIVSSFILTKKSVKVSEDYTVMHMLNHPFFVSCFTSREASTPKNHDFEAVFIILANFS